MSSLVKDVSTMESRMALLQKENERLKQESAGYKRMRSLASMGELTKILSSVGEIKRKLEEFSKNVTGILMSLPVDNLELTVRTVNCLAEVNIFSVEDLIKHAERELVTLNMGKKTINEIRNVLAQHGLSLSEKL